MHFDRQVLHLVFLFGSACAAPTRTVPTSSPSSTASLDDAPSLRLDIPPQLVSSVADIASQIISAVFPEHSSEASRRHVLDDESTSSKSYPPVALQTTRIAAPSDSKDRAVTSSTSTQRRSRTTLLFSSASETARASPSPASFTQDQPQLSSRTTAGQPTSPHHTTTGLGPASTHVVAAQASYNSTTLNNTMNPEPEPANMTGATSTADGLGGLLAAVGQATSPSRTGATSATGPTNALDVLFSALPSSLAAPIQSEFSEILDPIGSGIDSLTSNIFGAGMRTSRTRTSATNTPSTTRASLTSISTSLMTSTTPTTTPTALPPPTTTDEGPMTTMMTRPSDTDAAPATTTTAPPGSSAANPSENAATIGIATGVASGFVLLGLAGLWLWRRRQQGRAPFKRVDSNRVYPEVAWLYDPDITPPRSRAGSGSGAHLIPAPRAGSVEIGGTPVMGGASPEMRPARSSSPLLAPVLRGSRDMVGSRSRSGSEVDLNRLQPLSALREETPRVSMS